VVALGYSNGLVDGGMDGDILGRANRSYRLGNQEAN